MDRYGQAHVKDNRYKLTGSFHEPGVHTPIRDRDQSWKLLGVTNPRSMIYLHAYGGEAIFFESLSAGKLLGTRCDSPDCDSLATIYLPYRIHCPDCLTRCTATDLTGRARQSARIHTFMICERSGAFSHLEPPIKFINIAIDGVATILMSYLSVGEPAIGVQVVPIFRKSDPTYTITDLSWVIEGTGIEELPEGFIF
jgi:uncharacterized OB-fold protein